MTKKIATGQLKVGMYIHDLVGLSITPLRRELKRLERSGMLRAFPEANILFYTVDAHSAPFLQLKQAGAAVSQPAAPVLVGSAAAVAGSEALDASPSAGARSEPVAGPRMSRAIPLGVITAPPQPSAWRAPLSAPLMVGVTMVGLVLALVAAGLFYVSMTNQQLASQASRMLATRKAEVTVVVPPATSSGAMHGRRWRVVPGGFGGFSSGSGGSESY